MGEQWDSHNQAAGVTMLAGDPRTSDAPPEYVYSFRTDDRELFAVLPDGSVRFGPGMTRDRAARQFWELTAGLNPLVETAAVWRRERDQLAQRVRDLAEERDHCAAQYARALRQRDQLAGAIHQAGALLSGVVIATQNGDAHNGRQGEQGNTTRSAPEREQTSDAGRPQATTRG